ncbi:hypothetical protein [Candidatus Methanomassiliicoccus intestinalis]|uniref:hypothetical protein n=2 Tax=Candidatus Methanomassiliicoccus intestinalis TaxID=1406512 RepID=UPI0037DC943B
MVNAKVIAVAAVAILVVAGIGIYVTTSGDDDTQKGGFYSWDPTVLEVNGAYSNSTPSLLTMLDDLYEGIYGDLPSTDGIDINSIPSEDLWLYEKYVTVNDDGTLSVRTYNSSSTGKTAPNAVTSIESTAEKVVCYTAAYVDTIYNILLSYYEEDMGNSPKADARLWEIVVGVSSDCKSALESDFNIKVPSSVLIFDLGEKLVTYSEQLANECAEDENIVIFMTEYNIRSTNAKITEETVNSIENNTNGKVKFVFLLSNSLSMVLSNTEMIGSILGIDYTEEFISDALVDIYAIKSEIKNMALQEKYTVYVETASGKAAGSGNLITNLLTEILDMDNIADSLTLMESKLSDEQIINSQPDVIIFYSNDSRTMDEKMRVPV